MLNVGVIGCGYWGTNLVRNFADSDRTVLAMASDLDAKLLAKVQRRYPGVRITADADELIRDPGVDAVAIATPVSTHHRLAAKALEAGKHVWVEKPIAATSAEAQDLVEIAARRGRVLMVDHTFVYTGAIRKMAEMVRGGDLGDVLYYDSVRVSLGLFQHDVNVIWDLAVHDFAILDYVLPGSPVAVSATGVRHVEDQHVNMGYVTLFYPGNVLAHMHVNWLAPVKIRRTLLGGTKRMIVYDELDPSEKLRVYDRGVTFQTDPANVYQLKVGYRSGDMLAPKLDVTEALRSAVNHFAECIEKGSAPVTDGRAGARVVAWLEAAGRSIERRGEPVPVG